MSTDDAATCATSQGEEKAPLSVSAAMALAKGSLESITVKLVGEVSELSDKPGYKAVYFTVKDDRSALPCMMWNNRYSACGVSLYIGALVELTGRFTLYTAKGRMNFDVFEISLAGEGELRMRVAQTARRLQSEGLFAPERKRSIPPYPERIGLVTSPRGAAVHDVLRTLRRRFPMAEVLLAGVPVEGAQAPEYLMEGLAKVADAGAEVIALVRGGGSFEDLMPFNDEQLARAIAASPVPVVTGIGHEPDTSIADMAADLRASTPTAAAEALSPSVEGIMSDLDALSRRLAHAMFNAVSARSVRVERIEASRIFSEPMRLFESEAMALDDLSMRLFAALPNQLASNKARLRKYEIVLTELMKGAALSPRHDVELSEQRLLMLGQNMLERFKGNVALSASRLDDLSPLGVVARGYSLARDVHGCIVSSVDQVKPEDALRLTVSDGIIDCKVERTDKIELSLQEF